MSFTDLSDDDDSDAGSDSEVAAGDGQPGYPIQGHPQWRAGVPDAPNVLGMVKLPPGSARQAQGAPAPSGDADAPFAGPNDPRLIKTADHGQDASSGALDYEKNSWRWYDPDALTYDLQRKQGQLAQAQMMAKAAPKIAQGNAGVMAVARGPSSWKLPSGSLGDPLRALGAAIPSILQKMGVDTPVGAASVATGAYMSHVETPMLQREIQAIQTRLAQLRGASST